MPEVIFNGPEGRLEGRYHHNEEDNAPIALILHPNPQHGGTMNNRVVYNLFQLFKDHGFSVLRFNFRGVGRSQGEYDGGLGEMSDAAGALDWMQSLNPNSKQVWVAGFSFGALIAMQLMMRRPEIEGFIAVAPPASTEDFSFLAPCPSSGLLVHGEKDSVVPVEAVDKLADKLHAQKNITVDYEILKDADHYFADQLEPLMDVCKAYLEKRLAQDAEKDDDEETAGPRKKRA